MLKDLFPDWYEVLKGSRVVDFKTRVTDTFGRLIPHYARSPDDTLLSSGQNVNRSGTSHDLTTDIVSVAHANEDVSQQQMEITDPVPPTSENSHESANVSLGTSGGDRESAQTPQAGTNGPCQNDGIIARDQSTTNTTEAPCSNDGYGSDRPVQRQNWSPWDEPLDQGRRYRSFSASPRRHRNSAPIRRQPLDVHPPQKDARTDTSVPVGQA